MKGVSHMKKFLTLLKKFSITIIILIVIVLIAGIIKFDFIGNDIILQK